MVLGILLSILGGCTPAPECSADTPCPFGATCVDGACQSARCATSAQCGMEQHCADGACVAGCAEDADCYPGDACDAATGACGAAACQDAQTDCAFKEFCNGASGECYEAAGYYCRPCLDDDDCGGEGSGNYCTGYGYCGVECQDRSDCPAGFDCVPFVDLYGNIQYFQCFTYCWLYEDAGTRSPPPPPVAGRPLPREARALDARPGHRP